MNNTKHTPLPWAVHAEGEKVGIITRDGVSHVATVHAGWEELRQQGNAAMIVRAVNNHAALVEALEKIADADYGTDTPKLRATARAGLAAARE